MARNVCILWYGKVPIKAFEVAEEKKQRIRITNRVSIGTSLIITVKEDFKVQDWQITQWEAKAGFMHKTMVAGVSNGKII